MRLGITFTIGMIIAAMVAATLAGNAGPNRDAKTRNFPPVSDLVSRDATVRKRAIGDYLAARKELMRKLAAIVHPKTGGKLDNTVRAQACFLLAKAGTSNEQAIQALIAAVDSWFLPFASDVPYGVLNPGTALVWIGKPAVAPVLDELAETEGKKRTARLRAVLEGIEGVDCAIIRIRAHVEKEADPKKKARLKAALKYFEERKAKMGKK